MLADVMCPYCNNKADLMGDAIFRGGNASGVVWACLPCDARVGVVKKDAGFKPLGRLANEELREIKKKAYGAFEQVARITGMNRSKIYNLVRYEMGISNTKCQLGLFDVDQCQQAIDICLIAIDQHQP